ncbi:hypothetical protein LY78DRAFT_403229 [Colletotrichum sublineola]|nr:hypothetical protein LY78DRAFT_403229 [Colletotrichum sublineola]
MVVRVLYPYSSAETVPRSEMRSMPIRISPVPADARGKRLLLRAKVKDEDGRPVPHGAVGARDRHLRIEGVWWQHEGGSPGLAFCYLPVSRF